MTTNMKFADVKEFMAEIGKMGEKEAAGLVQRAEFAVSVAIAASEGHINGTPKDALEVWTRYRSKHKNKLGDAVKDVEKAAKIRASETLQIIKCGLLPDADFASTLEASRKVIATADFIKGNTWDNMVKLARFQLKDEQEGRKLTPAQIEQALTPAAAPDKDELTQIKALIKSMEKLRDGTNDTETTIGKPAFPSDELDAAIDMLSTRLTMLELKQIDAERAKKLRALGIAA
jgi:hypothetical protein